MPKRVARQRKDGHARAEDDGDDLLLLDAPKSTLRKSHSQSQSQAIEYQEPPEPSATLVESQKISATMKAKAKENDGTMDVDSETEPESDVEVAAQGQTSNGRTALLPTPSPSLLNASEASQGLGISQSQSQPQSQSQSQDISLDDGRAPGRIIGTARPLADFRKNIKQGDLVSKAVEDLAFVIKDIVLKPFSSRRQSEIIECMMELRETCLTVSGKCVLAHVDCLLFFIGGRN